MAYYSFVVICPQPLGLTKPLVLLDQGVNAFSAEVDDLGQLLERFKEEGVVVTQTNRLDDHEPGSVDDLYLPGEDSLRRFT